jgi:acyl-coenzyme A thioesterase PaaI-like protein
MLRGAPVGAEDLCAEGRLVHLTRHLGFAEGRIVDGSGTVYATATATCAILRSRDA